MSKRDPLLFMTDVLDASEKIERYTAGLAFDQFEANEMALDAVVRNKDISLLFQSRSVRHREHMGISN